MNEPLELSLPTPERVNLSLPVAGIGHRSLAYLLDAGVLFAGWAVIYFALSLAMPDLLTTTLALGSWARAGLALGVFGSLTGYWVGCELATDGQTLGKRAMHIRVVGADGAPMSALQSAVRNLMRVIDFLPVGYVVGVTVMLLDARHRRLGDLVAGTVAIRDEPIELDQYSPAAEGTQALAQTELEVVTAFLQRAPSMAADARRALAARLVTQLGGHASSEADAFSYLRRRTGLDGEHPNG